VDEDHIATRLAAIEKSISGLPSATSVDSLRSIRNSVTELRTALQNDLKQLGASVTETRDLQKAFRSELDGMREQFSKGQERLFAETTLLDARAQLDREFGHYQVVRRNATGMLRQLDAGIMPPAKLQEAAERLTLYVPGYWLAPALVAAFAWIGDSETIAKRAAHQAASLDPDKSALFFSLMAARCARYDMAGQWLKQYVRSLDCRSLSADFAVLIDAAGRGDLGAPACEHLMGVCNGWREQLSRDSELAHRQVERWRIFVESNRRQLGGEFDLLPDIIAGSDWNEKLGQLEANSVFGPVKDWLGSQLVSANSADSVTSIDTLLERLVAEHENDEAIHVKRADELQAAAGVHGNFAKPTAKPSNGKSGGQRKRDFLTLLTDTALSTPTGAPPVRVPPWSLIFSSDFLKEAIRGLRYRNERIRPGSIEIAIGGWRRIVVYSDSEEELAAEYAEFIASEMNAELGNFMVRLTRRSDEVYVKWQENEKIGNLKIPRVITDIHKFYSQWNYGDQAAEDCVKLIDNELKARENVRIQPIPAV
jgi:hypothetical protein